MEYMSMGKAEADLPDVGGDQDRPGSAGTRSLLQVRADSVAAVAAAHAQAVDREGRFPSEAFAAARAESLLGIMVPKEFGGEEASISETVDVCYALGRACSSSALIYAMHQVKVACVVRHGRGSAWHQAALRKLAAEQLLLASSTTEGQGGGNIRSSAAAVARQDARITLERNATVISYGEAADGIVTTARRADDALSSDQVLVVFLKDDYTLERQIGWDALGMRGTCSAGFTLRASGSAEQVLPVPYEKIHAETMTPVAHLMWSGAWAGVACAAVDRAEAFVRKVARQAKGQLPPGAAHLTKAKASLRTLRGMVSSAAERYERALRGEESLASYDMQSAMNLLKVDTSELAVATVMHAYRTCGLSGYRNDSEFSIGRQLRDVLSSPVMINNDRILANMTATTLMSGVPRRLRD
jgi:acyl-CoA dehydrogenase